MKRRAYLTAAGTAAALGLAGCTNGGSNGHTSGTTTTANTTTTNGTTTGTTASATTLTVAAYSSYVGKNSPGAWLKKHFEAAHDGVTVEYTTPTSGSSDIQQYIQRAKAGANIDADVYVGLNTDQLVLVDEKLHNPLFADLSGDLSHAGDLNESLQGLDSKGRAYPYDTGYITPVANAKALGSLPSSFDDLAKKRYASQLLMENAQSSDTGKAFLLWSIHEKGPKGYLDYWKQLLNGGTRVIDTWQDAYNHYTKGNGDVVVSYSTDQVYAANNNEDLKKYSVVFLNDEGYANPESAAVFAGSQQRSLATAFVDFMLSPAAQKAIPQLNYEFPSTTTGSLSGNYAKYAKTPPKPVTLTYDDLKGNVSGWVDKWARLVAQH